MQVNKRSSKGPQEQQQPEPHNHNNHHNHYHHHHHHNYHHHEHQSIKLDPDTSHDVQIFHNQSNTKSEKIISITAPILLSNLSSSHRPKTIKLHKKMAVTTTAASNGQRNQKKSIQSQQSADASHNFHAKKRQRGINHDIHKLAPNNQYGNGSQFDNNIVTINYRHQTSLQQQFKSKFNGHDIPYPPVDLPVS